MKKGIKLLVSIVLTFLIFPYSHVSTIAKNDDSVPKKAAEFAETYLPTAMLDVGDDFSEYGFTDKYSSTDLTIDYGIQVVYLDADLLKKSDRSRLHALIPNNLQEIWQFTLMNNAGVPQVFLSIQQSNGKDGYEFSRFGRNASAFVRSLQTFEQLTNLDGQQLQPVLLAFGQDEFLICEKGDKEYILPVESYGSIKANIPGNRFLNPSALVGAMQRMQSEHVNGVAGGTSVFDYYAAAAEDPGVASKQSSPWSMEAWAMICLSLLIAFLFIGRTILKRRRMHSA